MSRKKYFDSLCLCYPGIELRDCTRLAGTGTSVPVPAKIPVKIPVKIPGHGTGGSRQPKTNQTGITGAITLLCNFNINTGTHVSKDALSTLSTHSIHQHIMLNPSYRVILHYLTVQFVLSKV